MALKAACRMGTMPIVRRAWRLRAQESLAVTTLVLLTISVLGVLVLAPRAFSQAVGAPMGLAPGRTARLAARLADTRGLRLGGRPAAALDRARRQHLALAASPRAENLSAAWSPVGPASVLNPQYGPVTGRVTAIAIDAVDPSGNTVYVGTTGGGVWKSANAAGPAEQVQFAPLTDTLPVFDLGAGSSAIPSLSIGALAVGGGVVLAGTGDPNDATDSYYGGGLLRSADGGLTWTLIQGSQDAIAGGHTFVGLSVAQIAFSTSNPRLVVAAFTTAREGQIVAAGDASSTRLGLSVSTDAGQSWQIATVSDGNQVISSALVAGTGATSVVWNPVRQSFFAALVGHGFYQSADGVNWTRLTHQPVSNSSASLLRGVLAADPVSGDTFALSVDTANHDLGLFHDVCAAVNGSCSSPTVTFASQIDASALELGGGSTVIFEGDYTLALDAMHAGADTLLFAGTIDLYRCSLAAGCLLRNTTNAQDGCATPAGVAGAQHALASLGGGFLLVGNDGGLWRSSDGVAESGGVCSAGDAAHFDNLNPALGSLAEVVSFAQDPIDPSTLLAGLGALGSAGTGSGGPSWTQMSIGEGGLVAVDADDPLNWYVTTGAGVNLAHCARGAACGMGDFATTAIGAAQVEGDDAEVHAPWLLDPQAQDQLLLGTCRVWRGPAAGGSAWSEGDLLSEPFAAKAATGCSSTFTLVRSIGAGGGKTAGAGPPNAGSNVLYAGMEGSSSSGASVGGHVFAQTAAQAAGPSAAWVDVAGANVTNAASDQNVFNPGRFDISAIAVDAHDAAGGALYATIMGFAGNPTNSPHVYRSADFGQHWLNISANLPNAPANSVAVDPNDANTVYVALDTGVYVTTAVTDCPFSSCWSVYGTGLPNSPALTLVPAPRMATGDGRTGELRVGTYGRGIWQVPLVTAVLPQVPAMTLNPTSLSFGAQQVGTQSAAQTISVTNTGVAALNVSSVVAGTGYVESDTCIGTPVAPGASCQVNVRFAPVATGATIAVLTIYGNVIGGQATASLTGSATAPAEIVLTPLAVAYPPTDLGMTAATQDVTISNTGGNPSSLTTVSLSGDFSITANSCSNSLAPQTGCTVVISFRPTASGVRTGSLIVVDDQGTQTASLTGTGTSPASDSLAPLSLSFPLQQIRTASAAQRVTLTNAGDDVLSLISAQATGDFSVVNGCGASLAGHGSCSLLVSYVPGNVGIETGVLTVADAFRSQTVALSGIGAAPPGVSLSPAAGLTFGPTGVGLVSAAQVVTLTNNGDFALTFNPPVASSGFVLHAGPATPCVSPLAAHTACVFSVASSPTQPGPFFGQVTLTDNAASSPQALPLNGEGVDFSLASDGPASLSVTSGQTATYLLLMRSAAGVPGVALFTCGGLPQFSTCTVSPANPALGVASGTVMTVTVATGQGTNTSSDSGSKTKLYWAFLALPACLLLRRRRRGLETLLGCVVLLVLAGCTTVGRTIPPSGTGTNPDPVVTPKGTYTIVVAGSSAGLVRAVQLQLKVQ